jgi:Delta6-protoilludene synthase
MEDHRMKRIRNVEGYLALRRDTCGVASTLSIIEFGLDLPEDVLRHPIVANLTEGAVKLIGIINVRCFIYFASSQRSIIFFKDLNSYLMEQSRGLATHNVVTVAMHEFKLDHTGAMDWLEDHIKEDVNRFLINYARLPSWGEDIDGRLKTYIDGLGYWVRGNDCWSFEGQRYFGAHGPEIQKSRWVTLQSSKEGFVKSIRVQVSSNI